MKHILIITLILGILFGVCGCSNNNDTDTDEIDGGVITDATDAEAPKTVDSEEISEFYCNFCYITVVGDEIIPAGFYELSAKLSGENVSCEFDYYGNDEEYKAFTSDKDFLKKLDAIVKKYNLPSFNGMYYFVSGLGANYGTKLDITYLSGESVYAVDNQGNYLPDDAIKELYELFKNE